MRGLLVVSVLGVPIGFSILFLKRVQECRNLALTGALLVVLRTICSYLAISVLHGSAEMTAEHYSLDSLYAYRPWCKSHDPDVT